MAQSTGLRAQGKKARGMRGKVYGFGNGLAVEPLCH